MPASQSTLISRDGASIGYESVGKGPSLLFVHGASSARQRWQPVVDLFAPEFTMHLMDRRGRGLSGDGAAYAIEREVEDVAAVAAQIGDAVAVVAHSYGAICALEAALHCPSIRALVLYEPPIPTGPPPPEAGAAPIDHIDQLVQAGDAEAALLSFYQNILRMPQADIERLRESDNWAQRVDLAPTLPRELRAARQYRYEESRFAALEIPVLIMLGGDSPPRYVASTELLQRSLPRARTVILAGQQHQAINTAPALFAAEALSFLRSLP